MCLIMSVVVFALLIIDDSNPIQGEWADHVSRWESCTSNKVACPDMYVDYVPLEAPLHF